MEHTHAHQIQQARTRIQTLLREVVGRNEIIPWIKEVVRSVLDRAQEVLRDVEAEQESIRTFGSSQYRWSNRVQAFERKALGVLAEVGESVRMLGEGGEESKILDQIEQTQELVRRVCAMCIGLISGEGDLLVEEIEGVL